MEKTLGKNFQENVSFLDGYFFINQNFDIVKKEIDVQNTKIAIYFIDGFLKDSSIERTMNFIMGQSNIQADILSDPSHFASSLIPYSEVDITDNIQEIERSLLSGAAVFLVSTFAEAVVVDTRTYPVRGIKEPESDRVLRGAHVGFVETLIFNTALLRRQVRDRNLIIEILNVGETTKSDVAICYMKDRADPDFVSNIKKRISNFKISSLTMSHQSLAEMLFPKQWYNPFPKIRYTERPDAAASTILEGKVLIFCDNSPAAMILPTGFLDFLQESDDYYFPPFTGSYLRILRIITAFLTVFLTPIWYLLIRNPSWIPEGISFIRVDQNYTIPIIMQLLISEFVIDGLKMASLNTPDTLSNSLGIIGGLIIGDFAADIGWVSPDVVFYIAFSAVANYTQTSYELGYAFKFMRIMLLILTCLFNWIGFLIGILIMTALISFNEHIDSKAENGYLYPLIPFNGKAMLRLLFRVRFHGQD